MIERLLEVFLLRGRQVPARPLLEKAEQVDLALPPDFKSKPTRSLIVIGGTALGLVLGAVVVLWRRYRLYIRESAPENAQAWQSLRSAWRLRG